MTITIDLRKDAEDVRALLIEGIHRYVAANADPVRAPDHPPVSALSLTYDCGFAARVLLHFDTRPDFEPDGTWTHDSFEELPRPEWEQAYTTLQEGDLQVIDADGSTRTLPAGTDDETYAGFFGPMLVGALTSAREAGEFAPLPKTPGCELGVEEIEGLFGWPDYDDRGKDNLA